jgi:phosphonate transport system substrate-binding protein
VKKLIWIVILISLLACTPEPKVKVPIAEPLTMVIIPSADAVLDREQFAPFVAYLSDAIDREVKLLLVSDYTTVVDAMKYGWADIARFGPFSYVLATEEADIEAIAVEIKKNTGRPEYNALIVARADSGVTDLNGVMFAYVDVGSTSGYLAPSTYLKKEGVVLGETLFAGSHDAVILAVKNGSVQAGAIADNRYFTALEEGVIDEGEFAILWESDPIPNVPFVVQKSMDAETKALLLEALLSAPRELVEGQGTGGIGYTEVSDADYDFVRDMAKNQ